MSEFKGCSNPVGHKDKNVTYVTWKDTCPEWFKKRIMATYHPNRPNQDAYHVGEDSMGGLRHPKVDIDAILKRRNRF